MLFLFALYLFGIFWFLVGLNLLAWFIARRWFMGEDLTQFDRPVGERFSQGDQASDEVRAVVASFSGIKSLVKDVPLRKRVPALRAHMDSLFADRDFTGFAFVPTLCDGVPAEWVLAPTSDGRRRTLYIHGGAFTMGKNHDPVQDIYLRKVEGKENKVVGVAVKNLTDPPRGCKL